MDSTVALKGPGKPQCDIIFRSIMCVNLELAAEPTTDSDVRFSHIPEFDYFDFLLCCKYHYSWNLVVDL